MGWFEDQGMSFSGVVINGFYWLLTAFYGGWYLVKWTTDVPTEKWGRLAGLSDDEVKQLDAQEAKGRSQKREAAFNAMSPAASDKGELEAKSGYFSTREEFYFRSLGLFKLDNPLRRHILVLVHQQLFDNFILVLIATNAGLMALEDPLEDPDNPSEHTQFMEQVDFLFLLAFTGELVLKVIAFGLVRFLYRNQDSSTENQDSSLEIR